MKLLLRRYRHDGTGSSNNSSDRVMYRLVFESQPRPDKRLLIEHGPWLVDRGSAEYWKTYYTKLLPNQTIWIETGENMGGVYQAQ
jgi:hypothetical protein